MTFFITPFHYTDCFSVRQIGYGGRKLEQEIARNVEESLRTRGEVLALIGQIQDPSENAVLVLHYINGDSLERVGEKMDRSERWARDKHTQALDRLCGL